MSKENAEKIDKDKEDCDEKKGNKEQITETLPTPKSLLLED